MRIRTATEDDFPEIVRFRMQLCDSYMTEVKSADVPDFAERITARARVLLSLSTACLLVAQDDDGRLLGCIAGSVELSLPGPTWPAVGATIHDTWVEEDARGRGVARALVDAVCEWVREQGGTKVKLHSTPMGRAAYERIGFHVAEARPGDERFSVMWLDFPED